MKKIISLMKVYGFKVILLVLLVDLIMKCDEFFMIDLHALFANIINYLDKFIK
jgi:hypothetical protein